MESALIICVTSVCPTLGGGYGSLRLHRLGGGGRAQALFPCLMSPASSVKVMPFANLMSLLGPSIDSVAVLRGIQKVAMLVQGNWVVKR